MFDDLCELQFCSLKSEAVRGLLSLCSLQGIKKGYLISKGHFNCALFQLWYDGVVRKHTPIPHAAVLPVLRDGSRMHFFTLTPTQLLNISCIDDCVTTESFG